MKCIRMNFIWRHFVALWGLLALCSSYSLNLGRQQKIFPKAYQPVDETRPQQVHLALGGQPNSIIITWVTFSKTSSSTAEYGLHVLSATAEGRQDRFTDGGPKRRSMYMHRVLLTKLKPEQIYMYHVGSAEGWSSLFWLRPLRPDTNWTPRLSIYGDMGNINAQSLGRLQEETQRGHFDAILHVGDFAYNMDTDDARVGDEFMNQIESIAAYVPYMVCPGNHEQMYNFSNYAARFSMPGREGSNFFFSFDIGPAHFVSFSSEFYYNPEYGVQQMMNQYRWLEQELEKSNSGLARRERPWLITMCHRPMYCSNSNEPEHCPADANNMIRTGLNGAYAIEDLLYKHGVDLHIQAHEHSYERTWPVYNQTVRNGTKEDPYLNPGATVHIITGSAGCQERIDPFTPIPHPWSAAHSIDYGYTRVTYNHTQIYLEQVSDDQDGKVIDKMVLRKTRQQPFTCHMKK